MAFVKDNKKGDTSSVSSTPLSSGPQPSAQPSPEPTGQTPVTQAVSQPESQSQTSSSAPKSSSSGMFNNIQKYVEKNKPKAQEMAQESRNYVDEAKNKAQEASNTAVSGFATQTQASGLHDTENRVNEVTSFTEQESGMNPTPPPAPEPQSDVVDNALPATTPAVADLDDNQFANIMNARYTGPQSLIETGNLYNDLSAQAKESARIGDLAQNNRNSLLKDIYTTGTNQYNSGQSDLDSYLLGNQEGALKNIMESGKKIGTQQDMLRDASNQTISQAKNISEQIGQTREQARDTFKTVAGNRQGQIDTRVGKVVENWDNLPAHFREAFSSPDGSPDISALEAKMIGVNSGEGLYGMQGDDLFAKQGEEGYIDPVTGQLITTQESGNLQRLQALSNMARTKDKLYNIKDSEFGDVEQAGTQSAMDALNLGRVRDKLAEAEGNFRDFASQKYDVIGRGKHGYKDGIARTGSKKNVNKEYGTQTSLKDILGDKYDFNKDIITENTGDLDMVKDMANAYQNSESYQNSGGYDGEFGTPNGSEIQNEHILGQMGMNAAVPITDFANFVGETFSNPFEGLYQIGENLDQIPLVGGVAGDFVQGLAGLAGGGEKRKAERYAMQKAIADYKVKYQQMAKARMEGSGVMDRVKVADTDETRQRFEDLRKLLSGIDMNNT